MVASGSASKFHVAAAKTKPSKSRTMAPTPHLLTTGPYASMFNSKEDVGGGVQVEGEDIEIVGSTSTWLFISPLWSSMIYSKLFGQCSLLQYFFLQNKFCYEHTKVHKKR